jgi:RNA polymerase sigma factor (sigma-70 family)
MRWELATKEQLWTIIRTDGKCPLPLLEGVFHEAVSRGMIQQFILSVIKKKFGISENGQKLLKVTHEDLIQIGYEGALKALKAFEPGKGSLSNLLFITISQLYGQHIQYVDAQKRQREEFSYNQLISENDHKQRNMEFYLIDKGTNVEKKVITKIQLEEKLSLLNDIQKETFLRFFKGFTYEEIGQQMDAKKTTVAARMKTALWLMTGRNLNLKDLGIFERASFKGA